MTINKLITKLKKFDPDGTSEVYTHFDEDDQGDNKAIDYLSIEEGVNGKLVIVIHTADDC